MPIYDYKCINCGKDFEYFHVRSDDKVPECSHCGSKHEKHEKQISKNTGFILKGRGWAKDKYGK